MPGFCTKRFQPRVPCWGRCPCPIPPISISLKRRQVHECLSDGSRTNGVGFLVGIRAVASLLQRLHPPGKKSSRAREAFHCKLTKRTTHQCLCMASQFQFHSSTTHTHHVDATLGAVAFDGFEQLLILRFLATGNLHRHAMPHRSTREGWFSIFANSSQHIVYRFSSSTRNLLNGGFLFAITKQNRNVHRLSPDPFNRRRVSLILDERNRYRDVKIA